MLNKIKQSFKNSKTQQAQIFAKLKFWQVFWIGGLIVVVIPNILRFILPQDIMQSINMSLLGLWLFSMFKTRSNLKNKVWFYVGFYGVIALNVVGMALIIMSMFNS